MLAEFARVDTLELKDLIYKTIGQQRAENYFDQLNRFLNSKLSKAEFDKSCKQTIGRENIPLHNRLLRSILQNATQARAPPRKSQKAEGLNVKVSNGYQRNYLQSLYSDAFPQSPRKCRSPLSRGSKFKDRPSPLGPLGKSPSTITCEETVTRTQEQQSGTDVGEEVESLSLRRWNPISAPLGVSFGSHKACIRGYKEDSCEGRLELPDTISLRGRLQKKLALEGNGISLECADVINRSLDLFLKRIIEPCVSISSSKCRDQQSNKAVRMVDFRAAMESNPRLLGPEWPVQLEKISHYASEE